MKIYLIPMRDDKTIQGYAIELSEILPEIIKKDDNLLQQLKDGYILAHLLKKIDSNSINLYELKKINLKRGGLFEAHSNLAKVLSAAKKLGINVVNIGPEDIFFEKERLILGFLFQLFRAYYRKKECAGGFRRCYSVGDTEANKFDREFDEFQKDLKNFGTKIKNDIKNKIKNAEDKTCKIKNSSKFNDLKNFKKDDNKNKSIYSINKNHSGIRNNLKEDCFKDSEFGEFVGFQSIISDESFDLKCDQSFSYKEIDEHSIFSSNDNSFISNSDNLLKKNESENVKFDKKKKSLDIKKINLKNIKERKSKEKDNKNKVEVKNENRLLSSKSKDTDELRKKLMKELKFKIDEDSCGSNTSSFVDNSSFLSNSKIKSNTVVDDSTIIAEPKNNESSILSDNDYYMNSLFLNNNSSFLNNNSSFISNNSSFANDSNFSVDEAPKNLKNIIKKYFPDIKIEESDPKNILETRNQIKSAIKKIKKDITAEKKTKYKMIKKYYNRIYNFNSKYNDLKGTNLNFNSSNPQLFSEEIKIRNEIQRQRKKLKEIESKIEEREKYLLEIEKYRINLEKRYGSTINNIKREIENVYDEFDMIMKEMDTVFKDMPDFKDIPYRNSSFKILIELIQKIKSSKKILEKQLWKEKQNCNEFIAINAKLTENHGESIKK